MSNHTFVSFQGDFPFDEAVPPLGLALARFIVDGLRGFGYEVTAPKNHDDYAWYSECRVGKVTVWFVTGFMDDDVCQWLITTFVSVSLWQRFLGKSGVVEQWEVCDALCDVLAEDGRIRNVRWYTKEAWDCGAVDEWATEP